MIRLFSAIFLITATTILNAQSAKDVFNAENIVWYGLDFSHARLIGVKDEKPQVIKEKWLAEWNDVSYYDRATYPFESAFGKFKVAVDNKVVPARNNATTVANLFGDADAKISNGIINKVIDEYKDGLRKEGFGAVFIVEYMDKGKREVAAHVTFFDIATRKVLFTKRLTGAAGAPGLKMFWSMGFSRICKEISDQLLVQWKKEVGAN
jgi:hypothetical protein